MFPKFVFGSYYQNNLKMPVTESNFEKMLKRKHFRYISTVIQGRFRVQNKVVTNFCKIDTIYIKVVALIFVVIIVVIIIIVNVAIPFCFEILVVTT